MKNLGKYLALISILLSSFATVLNTSMVRIASPFIQEAFSIDYSDLTWIFNGYQIVYAILLPVFGLLGDKGGRKKMLIGGLIVFGVGSVLCALSWSYPTLLLFRVVQAIGAAAIFPNAVVIATNLFPPEQQGRIIGLWGTSTSMGSVAGPSIGGFIIQYLGWTYIFSINVVFAIAALISITTIVKSDTVKDPNQKSFDYLGTIFLATIIISLVISLTMGPDMGWTHPLVLSLLAVFAFSAMFFPKIEKRSESPVIDLSLFRNKIFVAGTLCGGTHLMAIQGMNFLMPLFLTQVKGLDALAVGVVMIPQALIRLLISPISGVLADKYGNRVPITAGLIVRTLSLSLFAFLSPSTPMLIITVALLLDGAGSSLIWAPSMNAVLAATDHSKASSVTGVFNMLRFIMGVIGTVIIGLIMDKFFTGVPLEASRIPGFFQSYSLLACITMSGLLVSRSLPLRRDTAAENKEVAS
jgi:EmrB/QacA subfamily drug resistance transporter